MVQQHIATNRNLLTTGITTYSEYQVDLQYVVHASTTYEMLCRRETFHATLQRTTDLYAFGIYIMMSPKYSRAPSPLPDLAFALANFRELLAFMDLMMAPGCSEASMPLL